MIRSLIALLLALTCWLDVTGQGLDTLQLKTIFQEPYLAGVRPVFNSFSDDGRKIYFTWSDQHTSKTERFEVDLNGKNLKKSAAAPTGMRILSPDKKWVVFSQDGDLYISDSNGANKRLLSAMTGSESGIVWSTDSRKIAFVKDGDVFVLGISPSFIQQLTRRSAQEPAYSIWSWGAKNQRLLVSQTDNSTLKEVFFPSYVEKFVTPGGSRRGFGEITVSEIQLDNKKQRVLFSGMHRIGSRNLSKSEHYYLIDRTDVAQKQRELLVYDMQKDTLRVVFADSTKGWISGHTASFAPGTDLILLSSERDGWNHLYTVKPDGSQFKQITKGAFEIDWHAWLGDNSVLYASTEVDPGERHLYAITLSNGIITRMTKEPAFREAFRLSADRQFVVYEKTFWNQPEDLYALNLMNFKQEIRLTNSVPERFKQVNWQTPEYVRFKGRDGETMISMSVLKPSQMKQGQTYPVIVFVHGAGSLQNVYKGWSNNYYREYLFHQFLNQQGYVVIEVDYRHSLGYGRKFREDVTNWMGKYELEDIIDGLNHIQKSGYADMNRVGIYGGSYGGFMALYAVSQAPDRIHAAAALRAVTNWENYFWANPGYTWPRLGHPDKDTLHYKRSSPLTYADSLNRPVYILHGLIDDNVGFQDAVQYVERLIQTGNERFDMMLYPSERHSFTDPDAWYDEYRRIFMFFEKEVKHKK
jgi:dipeptidyl aminopeptidase/acylaminoacyl peptidase